MQFRIDGFGADACVARQIGAGKYAFAIVLLRFMPEHGALLLVQNVVIRQTGGDDTLRQTLLVVDAAHVAAIEFAELGALELLGVPPPR